MPNSLPSGTEGWDDYAAFYDWENARTIGRRDVAFWRRTLGAEPAPALELGCGTGRLLIPAARAHVTVLGIDRSAPMLARCQARLRRLPPRDRPTLVRADMRALPCAAGSFGAVAAPYGLLQSLLADRDLDAVLAEAARVLRPGGLFAADLVPDLAVWPEYTRRVRLRSRQVTLVETVRQDRTRGITRFDEEFIERRGGRSRPHRFSLAFRTRSTADLVERFGRAGLDVEAVHGDYRGRPWREGAETWLVLARRRAPGR